MASIKWKDFIWTVHSENERERFVGDIDISCGYMHAGYPIMTGLDVVSIENGRNLPFLF